MNVSNLDAGHKFTINTPCIAVDTMGMGDLKTSLVIGILAVTLLAGCGSLPAQERPVVRDTVRYQVVMTAASMLGMPYQYGGANPDEGFDCSGLVQYSYAQAGVQLPRTTQGLYRESNPVRLRRLRPGDILFFKLNAKRVSHVGIYLGDMRFIHAPKTGRDVSISSLNNRYWRSRLVSAGRMF